MKKYFLFLILASPAVAWALGSWTFYSGNWYNSTTGQTLNLGVGTYPPGANTFTPTPTFTNTFTPSNTPTIGPTQVFPAYNSTNLTAPYLTNYLFVDTANNYTLNWNNASGFFGMNATNELIFLGYGGLTAEGIGQNFEWTLNNDAQIVTFDHTTHNFDFSKGTCGISGLGGLTLFGGGASNAGPESGGVTVYDFSPTPTPHIAVSFGVTLLNALSTPVATHTWLQGIGIN